MYLSDATALRNKEDAQADLRHRINEDRKAVIAATKKQYPQIGILVSETTKFYAYIDGVYTESRFINAIVRKIEAAKAAQRAGDNEALEQLSNVGLTWDDLLT
jgi:hypothetical protein